MKTAFVSFAIVLASLSAQAKSISNSQNQVSVEEVSQVIQLAKAKRDSVTKTVNILVTDGGGSTDVGNYSAVYLSFTAFAEMGNISASFKIANVVNFISAARVAAGIYEVKTLEYRDEGGFQNVTYTINANQMFIDEQNMRAKCNENFCDGKLNTALEVHEALSKPTR